MKLLIRKTGRNMERGQVIFLFAFALVGLVAMVGLVTDTGILLIEYGKLKRGVDAAAISAAQQYRLENPDDENLNQEALENAAKNFLQLNDSNVDIGSIVVTSCASDENRPPKCNPYPDDPDYSADNRKFVQITAEKTIKFGFLNILGINSTTISVTSVGEAATIDMVLAIDTSESMAYGTTGDPYTSTSGNPGDDPAACNAADNCQPMKAVKDAALEFIDTLYLPYDRVAIITMTGQEDNDTATRTPVILLPLTSVRSQVVTALEDLNVFQPRECDGSLANGPCRKYDSGNFTSMWCERGQAESEDPTNLYPEFRPCPSSNIGGMLWRAGDALTDASLTRTDSFWVVVVLAGGPANATDPTDGNEFGYCPYNTFLEINPDYPTDPFPYRGKGPFCRDRLTLSRHDVDDTITWTYADGDHEDFPVYDADDYARDQADDLAALTTGEGVTIFTIGLGDQITSTSSSDDDPKIAPAENLLQYIANCAGEADPDTSDPFSMAECDSLTESDKQINHGQYFNAATSTELSEIFEKIANNIATRITQ